ncbi:MAG TPA: Hsp20/alpha crystallin family protein [Burkholderiaceae bacterium]|nr:Hsp20/alpha crystallin family protein [Burkholderiaceae bacterium]
MKTTWMTPLTRNEVFGPTVGDFFEDFLTFPTWMPMTRAFEGMPMARALMDVRDKGEKFEIKVDLPGVKKEDIAVTIDRTRVMITAETKAEKEVKEGEGPGELIHSERAFRRYARTFELPVEVEETGADAVYENGVLTLTLPKHQAVVSKRLAIH